MKQKLTLHENEEIKLNNKPDGKSGKGPAIYILIAVLIVVTFASFFLMQPLVSASVDAASVFKNISQNISEFFNWIMGRELQTVIVHTVRRWITVLLVGCSLAAVGAMYKSIFRNTLAAPTTMGIQEGGVLGSIIFIFFFGGEAAVSSNWITQTDIVQKIANSDFMASYGQTLFIFVGCFLGIFIVLLISTCAGKKTMSSATLILVGTVVNGAIAGITSAVIYELTMGTGDDDLLKLLLNITLGTFNYSYGETQLIVMSATLIPCMIIMGFFVNKMNIYSLGDEEAKASGMNIKVFRLFVILLGVFMTAITMIYVGHIAFVGFIVPQIAAAVVGSDFRRLYPASILLGGTIMVIVYDISIMTGTNDAISLITTFVAGFMIIFMLMKKRGRADGVIG